MEIDQTATPTTTNKDAPASSDYYYNSYAHFGIHEEMLKDEVRTKSYRNSIVNNKHLIKDKIVLDVGCGTGILSLFAARSGAKRVFAVDASDIAIHAEQIVKENGLEDIITVIKGKMEDVDLTKYGVDKVDVLISEWMGYCLLYESMLPTVLKARDRWLRTDGNGVILPDKATIYLVAIEDAEYKEDKINFCDNVYGFKMTSIKKLALDEPLVDVVDPKQAMSTPSRLITLDMNTVKIEDLAFSVPFKVTAMRDDYCHAFVTYFDIEFSKTLKKIYFSTGPHAQYTHWKQTVFYLKDVLTLKKGEEIKGEYTMKPNAKNPRDMDITVHYTLNGEIDKVDVTHNYCLR